MSHANAMTVAMDGRRQEQLDHPFWRTLDAANLWSVAVRRPKSSLAKLAVDCLDRLRRVTAGGELADPVYLIPIYNNAALIFLHNGSVERSVEISMNALQLCSTHWKTTGNVAWGANMLQPYVNLGRLCSLMNEASLAQAVFTRVFDYIWMGKEFEIANCYFARDLLEQLREVRNEGSKLESFAVAVYLVETSKTMLAREEFNQLFEFTTEVSRLLNVATVTSRNQTQLSTPSPTGAQLSADERFLMGLVLSELQARALAGLGKEDDALRIYSAIVKQLPRFRPGMTGIYCSAAELLLRRGNYPEARKLLGYGRSVLESYSPNPDHQLDAYHAHFAFALLHSMVGDLPEARQHAEFAKELARNTKHLIGSVRAGALSLLCSPDDREGCTGRPCDLERELHTFIAALDECFYPVERACALLELDSGLKDNTSLLADLASDARATLHSLRDSGSYVPEKLTEYMGAASSHAGKVNIINTFNAEIEQLYVRLRNYTELYVDPQFLNEAYT